MSEPLRDKIDAIEFAYYDIHDVRDAMENIMNKLIILGKDNALTDTNAEGRIKAVFKEFWDDDIE